MESQKSETPTNTNPWTAIAEYARLSPSPHNTQPLRIKIISNTVAEIYYDLSRGLPEGDPPARFALTAVGIFVEAIKIAAASMGYVLKIDYEYHALETKKLEGLQKVADLRLAADSKVVDLPVELLQKRRTNRLQYNNKTVALDAVNEIKTEVEKYGHRFEIRDDAESASWVTELNKRMVFYDLDEDNVRDELARWSRYTKKQAHKSKDGLSAECLHVPGWGLNLFMEHYGFLRIPGIRQLLQRIYWKNMQGITTVAWLEGPFATTQDYVMSGHVLMRVWLLMAKHGVAYHPFGSVITNQRSHKEFIEHFNINEAHSMAWLLMRLGYTDDEPPRSERVPLEAILL